MLAKAQRARVNSGPLSSVDAVPALCAGITTFSALRNALARAGEHCNRTRGRTRADAIIGGALTSNPATGDATLRFGVLDGLSAIIEVVPLAAAADAKAKTT
jgi:hypothetical protein